MLSLAVVSAVVLAGVGYWMFRGGGSPSDAGTGGQPLVFYCAAGMRKPIERIAADYEREFGVAIQIQYGGSNTLLNQIEAAQTGDLYLAAESDYVDLAEKKGLSQERLSLATMGPVIAVAKGNPKGIASIDDLLREDIRVALGNPDQAAVGKKTRQLLTPVGKWEALQEAVRTRGVFKPTVPEVANDVKLGSVDAAIIWDAVCNQYPELEAVRVPELDAGSSDITVCLLKSTRAPTAALRFMRYAGAPEKGLAAFTQFGYDAVEGDRWAEQPELTFFAGSVNRAALEPVIDKFKQREGVEINTVYNGCGILTATMETMLDQQQEGFPDMYLACDVYYLDVVKDHFQDAANISSTDIVIVVQPGNPKEIRGLADLARPGVRVALGQPDKCTIGVLSRKLLESEGLYDKLLEENIAVQTTSSALLVPNILTKACDAVLAYRTDTLAEADRLEVISIDSPLAKAVQPYSIARTSRYKQLARRLFEAIVESRSSFEDAGFNWQWQPGQFYLRGNAGPAASPISAVPPDAVPPDAGAPDKPQQR